MFYLLENALGEMSAEIVDSEKHKTHLKQKAVTKKQRQMNQQKKED